MKRIIPTLLFSLVAAASMQAYATPILTTMDLGTVFTGTTPNGTAPWLTAAFTSNTGSNTGTLTLTSHLSGADFVGAHDIGWGFYLTNELSSFTCISGHCANNVLSGGNYNGGPTGNSWNLAFGWLAQNRFVAGETAVYDLTFDSALTNSPFGTSTGNKKGKNAGWSSIAHIQNINITGGPQGCSGWIVAGQGQGATGDDGKCAHTPPTNVPEPSVLGMFGLGALLIGLFAGLRRRQDRHSGSL